MPLVKITRNYQITLPKNLRKKHRITEGDYMEINENQEGAIIIKPVKVISKDQEYFYTKEWQEKEKEADQDIKNGELIGPFKDVKKALHALKNTKV
ncbi:MAG: AbrB family transcriptional regulator [Desulfuromonadales bacterium C00003096]|jgi:AbrB family looped-hinge helix DNA binding protein|nr:MAG: AbrB family transcriptional regulator [Desulfuromonadales bacterium C00003096]